MNGQIAQLGLRLGEEAPYVAEFYLGHQKAWYVSKCHSVDYLLADAESLRTQWASNRTVTEHQARSADRMGETGRLLLAANGDGEEAF